MWLTWVYSLFILSSLFTYLNGKSVITSLHSKWDHTSFLAETSEFIAKEGNNYFWDFLDHITDKVVPEQWNTRTHEKEFDTAVKQAVSVLSDARSDLLKFALALRLYSPKIQVFQQIAEGYTESGSCGTFIDLHGKVLCSVAELEAEIKKVGSSDPPTTYTIDHFFPTKQEDLPLAILYSELGTSEFAVFHRALKLQAKTDKIRYVFRHFSKDQRNSTKVGLSGYGVELAIKNTEYKAVDDSQEKKVEHSDEDYIEEDNDIHGFNFNVLRKNNEELRDALKQFKIHLLETEELSPLKQWEVSDISFLAAQKIVDAPPEEALSTLVDISQNFPTRARSLVQTRLKNDFRLEVEVNQHIFEQELQLSEGDNAFLLNGINIDVDSLDIFQLFEMIAQEEKMASAFYQMGFRREYLSLLHNLDLSEDKVSYGIDFRDAYPEYINNLDKDKAYRDWGNSVKLMLQPYFPGMIRPIARNFYTLVAVIDPGAPESRSIMKILHSFYVHQVPLRIGFVFVVNDDKTVSGKDDVGVALLNLYNFAKMDRTPAKAINLVTTLLDDLQESQRELTVGEVHKYFKQTFSDQDIDDVFSSDSDYDTGRTAGKAFIERSGLQGLPKVILNGIILDEAGTKADKIEETILMQVMKQTPILQRAIMSGKLTDKDNVQNWLLSQPDILPRLNNRLLAPPSMHLPLNDVFPCSTTTLVKFNALTFDQKAQCIVEKMKYLTKTEETTTHWLNVWLVTDLDSLEGRELLSNALKALKKSNNMRLAVIHNGEVSPPSDKSPKISRLIHTIIRLLPNNLSKQILVKLQKEETVQKVLSSGGDIDEIAVHGMNLESFKKEAKLLSNEQLQIEAAFAENVLGLKKNDRAIIVNGMLYGPFGEGEKFEAEDFNLLEKIAERKGAKSIAEQIEKWEVDRESGKASDVVLRSIATIGRYAVKKPRTFVTLHSDTESVVNLIADDPKRAILEISAIVDPLSKGAQKLAPILLTLTKVVNSDVKLIMNPKAKLSELPLKRFYRYALNEEPTFDANGAAVAPTILFSNLPSKQLLTLNVIAPDSWMIQPVYSEYDLDNIKMQTVKQDALARFELSHILLEGHCFDEVTGSPPRGLQFILGTKINPSMFDTIVMANLGYFQLKASPGAWTLQLREGKSSGIYDITNTTNAEGPAIDGQVKVLIDSFNGKVVRVRTTKKPGMEKKNLLSDNEGGDMDIEDDDEQSQSIWSSLSNKLGGGEKHEVINIFSLASGHLYERFMRIMILSVMKNTKHPVKFWLLNNYLSPQFRETLPQMAKQYNFEYELVEYKWPRWLHQQTEKQRIMWGYKLLFLDVLFPLNVKKIIFVDADQVVRADMMELMELDLDGAPYGYTPFCDSRTSMEGFRFWKKGYWATHLAGRKYHISALYVVDLVKFRQIAAGDRLRGQYQGLSADPNSLSNLDQDLPNNMIHQVRIKSLPQEWLWCETWCSDESKASAKTIDLCNNPQTKEPKLDSAHRIIKEWTEYDDEIKQLLQSDDSQSKQEETTQGHIHDKGGEL
uniref:UDP-glucose:glycoprotein glucosyltransferase n=1 Tax=Acrobeloides nanus TaxID=290746 RepID=A0A914C391_9BILA